MQFHLVAAVAIMTVQKWRQTDVHRPLRTSLWRQGRGAPHPALGAVPRRAMARCRLVGPRAGRHREGEDSTRLHASERAQSLLHALYARIVGRDCVVAALWRGRLAVLPRAPRAGVPDLGCRGLFALG